MNILKHNIGKFFNNKAQMTSTQLITVILSVTGFIILLYVISQIAFNQQVDREVCHESVIARATFPEVLDGKTKELFPLKCKTRKVCITSKIIGRGDCEKELGISFDTARVSPNLDKINEDINKFLAREMADCWTMMGEAEVQIFSKDATWDSVNKKCSICSRISFDKSITSKKTEIIGLGNYLFTHKTPNKEISYWDYLSRGVGRIGYNPADDAYNLNQKAIVFMEVKASTLTSWIGLGAGGAGGAVVGAKTGLAIGAGIGTFVPVGGTIAGGAIGLAIGFAGGAFLGDKIGDKIGDKLTSWGNNGVGSGYSFIDYNEKSLKELECDSLENIP
ncbi:MAG: hypothetical protein AABX30_03540 [Nanoarchaeota archaeon]